MTDPPAQKTEASGPSSAAASSIGVAATGDQPYIDARTINLSASAIPEPADVAAPPGMHNLPRRPARIFVGRKAALDQLRGALADDASAVVTQAVYGLGGVGKSELVLHHAQERHADYMLIWWITAEDAAQIQNGLAQLASTLCHEIAETGITTTDAAAWATTWLQTHQRWLLILDNVNEPQDVDQLLGKLTKGDILITTRRDTGWDRIVNPICLDVLEPGPATDLLTARTRRHSTADQHAAASIAAELGYLPLALDQAAAYITQTRITLAAYLHRLRQHPALMYAAATGGEEQRTIARVWDITIEAIQARRPTTIQLLHILACYAPDAIPRIILGEARDTDEFDVDEMLGMLVSYSMIALTPETVSVHRLVQAVILTRQPPEDKASVFGRENPPVTALNWLSSAIPANSNTNMTGWPLLRALIPHAEHLATLFPPGDQPEKLGRVQNELAVFQHSQGQFERALALWQSALAISEVTHGPYHPDTVAALSGLGGTYSRLGAHVKALSRLKRALKITETGLGPGHSSTALMLSNLAMAYLRAGAPDMALPLQERALKITETALGPNHPSTGAMLNNLASVYYYAGLATQALPLQERALKITETALGPNHPSIAVRLNNLGAAYRELGRADKALPLIKRALKISETALGPNHPNTATRLNNLGDTYRELGRADMALPLLKRALKITNTALGPDHPDTATILRNLNDTYRELGQTGMPRQGKQISKRTRKRARRGAPSNGESRQPRQMRDPSS